MTTLYLMPGSCALSCHIALEWTDADYDVELLDLEAVHGDKFKQVNPKGKVPAIREPDGWILTEALAILSWIGDRWPQARRFGSDPRQRSKVLEALSELTGEMHPAFAPLHVPGRFVTDAAAEDSAREAAVTRVRGHYDRWNAALQGRETVVGDRYGIADAYLFALCRWTGRIDATLADWPRLAEHSARMRDDSAVRSALNAEGLNAGDR